MAVERTLEAAGYRVNAKTPIGQADGRVTVYAERRNENVSLGMYGGDAYPAVYESDGAGIVLAADGVGQGGYLHPSLHRFLLSQAAPSVLHIEESLGGNLYVFLQKLYGNEIFEGKNRDALAYAIRCFSDVPADGFFVADRNKWGDRENHQVVSHFWERDSQSLGSRITCVGIFLKFRNYMTEHAVSVWDERSASALRREIETYLGELKKRLLDDDKIFNYEDAPDIGKRQNYFLPATVAVWFYRRSAVGGGVSALALNCGDARCYLADLSDGVRQISVDDALPNGNMTAFVHYGEVQRTEREYHDNLFRARIVYAETPCALIACSDGVYDTCPFIPEGKNVSKKETLRYGETEDSCDFLFEYNLLEAMRRCYSFDDFKREIVFNFFAQGDAREFSEQGDGHAFENVKRDDSGTLAARFFGPMDGAPVEFFRALRESKSAGGTTLDKLWQELCELSEEEIPYAPPHVESSAERNENIWDEYISRSEFSSYFLPFVKGLYSNAVASMIACGGETLWGMPHPPQEKTGFALNQFFNRMACKQAVFRLAVKDWLDCDGGKRYFHAWRAHEHILVDFAMFRELRAFHFEDWVRAVTREYKNPDADRKLRLYSHFCRCFYGEPLEGGVRKVVLPEEGRRDTEEKDYDELIKEFRNILDEFGKR